MQVPVGVINRCKRIIKFLLLLLLRHRSSLIPTASKAVLNRTVSAIAYQPFIPEASVVFIAKLIDPTQLDLPVLAA